MEKFAGIKKSSTFATSNDNNSIADNKNGLVAQLNRASDYGSEGYRFESCRGHKEFERTPFFVQKTHPHYPWECRPKTHHFTREPLVATTRISYGKQ